MGFESNKSVGSAALRYSRKMSVGLRVIGKNRTAGWWALIIANQIHNLDIILLVSEIMATD